MSCKWQSIENVIEFLYRNFIARFCANESSRSTESAQDFIKAVNSIVMNSEMKRKKSMQRKYVDGSFKRCLLEND